MTMEERKALEAELCSLARGAGAALPHDAVPMAVEDKAGKANYVTRYDKETQQRIFAGCRALVPGAVLIGEESFETGGALPDPAALPCSFIVDPIDGTTNFIRGYRHSGISIAYLEGAAVQVGVVYDPWQDECFSAVLDGGARVNGHPLQIAGEDLPHSLLCFGSSPYYPELQQKTLSALGVLIARVGDVRRSGSAALDLAYLAAGRTDAFFEMRLSPWDIAAGSLLVQQAGGRITDTDGAPLRLNAPSSVLAASPTVYDAVLQVLKQA